MSGVESTDFLVVGCGPAGATAAREAARAGIETIVLEREATVGSKRVCAAGLRPGFCDTFDLPRAIVHCDTPRLALFDARGNEHEVCLGPGHTSTREELDGTMARLAAEAGAHVRTQALFRGMARRDDRTIVEYADLAAGARRTIAARNVFLAVGATARLDSADFGKLAWDRWREGLLTTLQYRVYLERPALQVAYQTLELHYYNGRDGRQIIAWMFPKRDHLAIGLGVMGKIAGDALRAELDDFTAKVRDRLYSSVGVRAIKVEGHLLYGGMPRPTVANDGVMVGGTAAGLVDASNGEGIYEAAISGRLAADSVRHERDGRASARYGELIRARFARRLAHRVRLIRYLERRPSRYALLFKQLARTPRLAEIMLKEDSERTVTDRLYIYREALRFGLRTVACRE
jgi:geranylgeranyl diphosphate/geranylgeranyl-bacteriochlorophyllide a reductase